MVEFLFQPRAGFGDLGEELFLFGQEVVHIAWAFVGIVRVLEIEIEVAGLDLAIETRQALSFSTHSLKPSSPRPRQTFSDSNSSMRIGLPLL